MVQIAKAKGMLLVTVTEDAPGVARARRIAVPVQHIQAVYAGEESELSETSPAHSHRRGRPGREFRAVRNPANAIVVELVRESYARLILDAGRREAALERMRALLGRRVVT